MTRTIVFIHGAWVAAACWDRFVPFFEAQGYRCLAPSWPGKDRPVEAIRADPAPLAGLGIAEIVAHYESIIRELDEPPILIGHSFGGLFTQILLDRGLGAAYDRYVIPETGRIFFQSATATLDCSSPIRVDFANGTRAPLLLIAGAKDRIVPPVINRRNHRAYAQSPARTDFREYPDRTHWIIAQEGWQEVAEHAATWLADVGLPPASPAGAAHLDPA